MATDPSQMPQDSVDPAESAAPTPAPDTTQYGTDYTALSQLPPPKTGAEFIQGISPFLTSHQRDLVRAYLTPFNPSQNLLHSSVQAPPGAAPAAPAAPKPTIPKAGVAPQPAIPGGPFIPAPVAGGGTVSIQPGTGGFTQPGGSVAPGQPIVATVPGAGGVPISIYGPTPGTIK